MNSQYLSLPVLSAVLIVYSLTLLEASPTILPCSKDNVACVRETAWRRALKQAEGPLPPPVLHKEDPMPSAVEPVAEGPEPEPKDPMIDMDMPDMTCSEAFPPSPNARNADTSISMSLFRSKERCCELCRSPGSGCQSWYKAPGILSLCYTNREP